MNVAYHRWWSRNLGHDMELKVYGHAGKPVVVFPSCGGRFYEYEDFGMVEACRPFIDAGAVTLFTLDSVDGQSWLNQGGYFPFRSIFALRASPREPRAGEAGGGARYFE